MAAVSQTIALAAQATAGEAIDLQTRANRGTPRETSLDDQGSQQ
jgi:hypothetical protein